MYNHVDQSHFKFIITRLQHQQIFLEIHSPTLLDGYFVPSLLSSNLFCPTLTLLNSLTSMHLKTPGLSFWTSTFFYLQSLPR